MKAYKPRVKLYVIISAYLSIVFILASVMFSIPRWVKKININYVVEVQENIQNVLDDNEVSSVRKELNKVIEKYPMEIVIRLNNQPVYETIAGLQYLDLNELLNKDAIVFEAQGTIKGKSGTYDAWYSIYPPPIQIYLDDLTFLILLLILLLFFVLFLLSMNIRKSLINPLKNIKYALKNLENYRFEYFGDISDAERDEISEKLTQFALDLRTKIGLVSKTQTELEQTIQLEKERLENMLILSRGIIHDFKTPLHQSLLQNELYLKKLDSDQIDPEMIIQFNIQCLDVTLKRINEKLVLLDSDVDEITEVKNHFDVIELFSEIREEFRTLIEKKNLLFNIEIPEELPVYLNKISLRLVIHNILSNAVIYALDDGEIDFTIDLDDFDEDMNMLSIKCMNTSSSDNIKKLKESENLFTYVSNQKKEYTYSSGKGLFLAKELAHILHGTYEMEFLDENVIISISLPILKKENGDES